MNDASHQDIELRAYRLWENRGKPWGEPEVDWFKAEEELIADGNPLIKIAREVGSALGVAVAFCQRD